MPTHPSNAKRVTSQNVSPSISGGVAQNFANHFAASWAWLAFFSIQFLQVEGI
jgi:hypothetical protein